MVVKRKKIKICLLLLSLIIECCSCNALFGDINKLPKGSLIHSSISPSGDYTVEAFLCDGGATVDYAIRCSVTDSEGKTRNIYWNYHERTVEIDWLDESTVSINGIVLNVETDKYDYRTDANSLR